MKEIYTSRYLHEAHAVRLYLEAQDIACVVDEQPLASVEGKVPFFSPLTPVFRVCVVHDGDEEEARRHLEDYRERATNGEVWRCPNCGEEQEAQFTDCWHCGASRPGET